MKIAASNCNGWVLLTQETVKTSTWDFLTVSNARKLIEELQAAVCRAENDLVLDRTFSKGVRP